MLWLGTGPKIWLNLQQAYDFDVAQIEIGEELEIIKPLEGNKVWAESRSPKIRPLSEPNLPGLDKPGTKKKRP